MSISDYLLLFSMNFVHYTINTVNEGIAKLKAKGTFKEIEARWLGEAVPASADKSNSDTNTTQLN